MPEKAEPSKLLLRLPEGLHKTLRERAAQQGVSVNTLAMALLAGSLKWDLADDPDKQVPRDAGTSGGLDRLN